MSKKEKAPLWLVLAVLILTGAALFSLLPRRAALLPAKQHCRYPRHHAGQDNTWRGNGRGFRPGLHPDAEPRSGAGAGGL